MSKEAMMVLWPSFMVAIIAEGIFFSLFDPGSHMEIAPIAAYTIGFFCFWLFGALSSVLTCYLARRPGRA